MSDNRYYTEEGMKKMKHDLHVMKTQGRHDMARQIQEAREKGDLSENAEYDAAKEAQGMLERKIAQLEEELGKARILDDSLIDTSRVAVLSIVEIKNIKSGKSLKYTLVSEKEADVRSGKISVASPIGKGLLGKSVGEKAEISIPTGVMQFEILSISRA